MPIIYALVSRETSVLAEYTDAGLTGNFSTVTRVLLKKIPKGDNKLSYVYGEKAYVFHYEVSDDLIYLCMTDYDYNRMAAFEFLAEVKERFIATYGNRGKTANAFAFNNDFQPVIQQKMEQFNSRKNKVYEVQEKVNLVKSQMEKNIDQVLQRGEQIELLVDRTEELNEQAFKFKKVSNNLNRAMRWRNIKYTITLGLIVLIIIYIVVAFICGPTFKKCSKKN